MSLSTPQQVMERLEDLDRDLAARQLVFEQAALSWYQIKRDREHAEAVAFIKANGPMDLRKAVSKQEAALIGKQEEALYEALKAVMRTIETRVGIGQSLLRAQGEGWRMTPEFVAPLPERWVSRQQLAVILGVSAATVDNMRRAGMPSVVWGRRSRRFRPSVAEAWAGEHWQGRQCLGEAA